MSTPIPNADTEVILTVLAVLSVGVLAGAATGVSGSSVVVTVVEA